jgi:hypothetical protein
LSVAGNTVEEGTVLEFSTDRGWYLNPPVNFNVRFENTGNAHTKPSGLIEVFNAAGKKEAVIQINKTFNNVLPESKRVFTETWNPDPWLGFVPRIGKYTANGLLTFGLPSTTVDMGTLEFWLIPIPFILTVLAITLVVIVIILVFLRVYAQSVVKGYQKKSSSATEQSPVKKKRKSPRRKR